MTGAGAIFAFWSPTLWRWMKETCGFTPEESERVARWAVQALAELMGGRAYPFRGPLPGAFMALAGDAHGTLIEVYPETTVMRPGDDGRRIPFATAAEPAAHVGWHVNLSVALEREAIERIAAREGWQTMLYGAAPPGKPAVFPVLGGEPHAGRADHPVHARRLSAPGAVRDLRARRRAGTVARAGRFQCICCASQQPHSHVPLGCTESLCRRAGVHPADPDGITARGSADSPRRAARRPDRFRSRSPSRADGCGRRDSSYGLRP